MTSKQNKMHPKVVNHLTFINRLHHLEGIIFEMRETLKYYASNEVFSKDSKAAQKILDKYNKTWSEIYDEIDNKK